MKKYNSAKDQKVAISKAKRFSVFARQVLIENILAKKSAGMIGQQMAEEVAYTWFNRFSAIRFMEVNGYLDETEPVFHFRDGDTGFKNRILNICHRLSHILPEVFADKSDDIEKLFPDGLGTLNTVIDRLIEDIDEDQWKDSVETIGWLYQYYNGERKKEVFQTLKNNQRIKKDDLPVTTQLFTPEWLVEYMVENSLGRLWIENLKIDEDKNKEKICRLKETWKFYIPGETVAKDRISVEAIKVIDPCVGSGHVLSYVFDFLMTIYLMEGYSKEKAVELIVCNNIYGLEIDRRATQMAYFTVVMKALKYDPSFLEKGIKPKIYELEWNVDIESRLKNIEKNDLKILRDIKEYGSLINIDGFSKKTIKALSSVPWGQLLEQKYQVVITNPPYMTMYNMSDKMVAYVKAFYPDSKHDLFSAFIEKCEAMLVEDGYKGMVTQHSWMFLSVYKDLRKKMLTNKIISLLHLGTRGFEGILGDIVQTVAFVTMKSPCSKGFVGSYKRLVEGSCEEEKINDFFKRKNTFYVEQDNFKKLQGWTLTYWQDSEFFDAFHGKTLQDFYLTKKGMFTGNNDYFLKKWYEVPYEKLGTDFKLYNKGGRFRKWYGCNDTVVNWHDNGAEIKGYKGAGNINEDWFYETCLTWNLVSASPFCCRIVEKGAVMGDAGPICIIREDDPNYYYLLGYLNSMVAREFLEALNPTMNYPSGVVGSLPIKFINDEQSCDYDEETFKYINRLVKENIRISREDWNSYETARGFEESPLVNYMREIDMGKIDGSVLQYCYDSYKKDTNKRFAQLKSNEESLNNQFINIFGLGNHIDPKEEERDVTLTYVCDSKNDISENLKGCRYVKYMEDIVADFLSYIVGCIMGRFEFYNEDKIPVSSDGILYINDNEDIRLSEINYIETCCDDKGETIVSEDIASTVIKVIGNIFGNEKVGYELEFIKKALGAGEGKDPEKVLRKYFKKHFYRNHLKQYGRRPIYWQLDSGKYAGMRVLVYYHKFSKETIGKILRMLVYPKQAMVQDEIENIENIFASQKVKIIRRRALEKRLEVLENQKMELDLFTKEMKSLKGCYVDRNQGVLENYKKFSKVLSKN